MKLTNVLSWSTSECVVLPTIHPIGRSRTKSRSKQHWQRELQKRHGYQIIRQLRSQKREQYSLILFKLWGRNGKRHCMRLSFCFINLKVEIIFRWIAASADWDSIGWRALSEGLRGAVRRFGAELRVVSRTLRQRPASSSFAWRQNETSAHSYR